MKRVRLISARKSKKLTQEGLGTKVGVSQNLISHYESGTRTPSLLVAQKISEELGETVENLFN